MSYMTALVAGIFLGAALVNLDANGPMLGGFVVAMLGTFVAKANGQ
jgi:hypothetical protein